MSDGTIRRGERRDRLVMAAADITAMMIFSTALCMMIEIFIARLTFFQSVQARIAAIPVNLVTGRPYGWFRDRLFTFLGIDRTMPLKMIGGDTLAFVIFQVPLYVIVLLFAGATWKQIAVSSAFMSLIFSLAGRPYGIFLDLCRNLARRVLVSLRDRETISGELLPGAGEEEAS
ncbi:MAG TPA: L-alanine exporter AlaE [Synergistales bacterium]|nr:L-alanine exporter AlaE [Synergistales bacterium]